MPGLLSLDLTAFPAHLPITAVLPDIVRHLENHYAVIVAGPTGCGKTTQVPRALGYGNEKRIVATQPRRIAVRQVAARLSEEQQTPLGEGLVGYRVRFEEKCSPQNRIQVMTDGFLLALLASPHYLKNIDVVIIDEAHERSVMVDLLLGTLKRARKRYPHVKIVIMSATLSVEAFSKFLDQAPVVQVEGRSFPVEIRYQPPSGKTNRFVHCANVVEALIAEGPGDFLVFLSGEADIREAHRTLKEYGPKRINIFPLYARLKATEQNKIFQPSPYRKVILATNVAETSLTLPDVKYVIDFGEARASQYNPQTKVLQLPIEPIAQANAQQRAGRTGRTQPGICVRLYSTEDFQARPKFALPEIRRSNLAQVLLYLFNTGMRDIRQFPWFEAPADNQIKWAIKRLVELGAVVACEAEDEYSLTSLGKKMAHFPLDPGLARVLFAAEEYGILNETLVVAAALEVPDLIPVSRDPNMLDRRKKQFSDSASDCVTYYKLWQWWHSLRENHPQRTVRDTLYEVGLEDKKMREWAHIYRQLRALVVKGNMRLEDKKMPKEVPYEPLHKALLTGFWGGIGNLADDKPRKYQGLRGVQFGVQEPNTLELKKADWVLALELVSTTKVIARKISIIEPEWIVDIAKPFLKYHTEAPHFVPKRGNVCAKERITLYGLTLIADRSKDLGNVDPVLARKIFIQEGLVGGLYIGEDKFWKHNTAFLEAQLEQEARFRTAGLCTDEEAQYAFYDTRLPENVINQATLRAWLKTQPSHTLCFREEDFSRLDTDKEDQFPKMRIINDIPITIKYVFAPGEEEDGPQFYIPAGLISHLPSAPFSWLVPGLLVERVTALLKTLPKPFRRVLMPLETTAQKFVAETEEKGDLLEALAQFVAHLTKAPCEPALFQESEVPHHVRPQYVILDEKGKAIFRTRVFSEITKPELRSVQAENSLFSWEKFLPKRERTVSGVTLAEYAAIVVHNKTFGIEWCETEDIRDSKNVTGLSHYLFQNPPGWLKQGITRLSSAKAWISMMPLGEVRAIQHTLTEGIIRSVWRSHSLNPANSGQWEALLQATRGPFLQQVDTVVLGLPDILPLAMATFKTLHEKQKALGSYQAMLLRQWHDLWHKDTLYDFELAYFGRYPLYLKAIQILCDKLLQQPAKTVEKFTAYQHLQKAFTAKLPLYPHSLQYAEKTRVLRWQLWELLIATFAEHLKAVGGVTVAKVHNSLNGLK